MSESETCPVCKAGKLRPEEGRGVDAESRGEFRQTASAIDLVCDNASCRHKVSGSVTKKDNSNESPSDA